MHKEEVYSSLGACLWSNNELELIVTENNN